MIRRSPSIYFGVAVQNSEAPEETTITDQARAQPIEEDSTQEVVVPAGASDISNMLLCSFHLGFRDPGQHFQSNKKSYMQN